MKRLLIALLAVACIGIGVPVAQNVTRGVQVSQDPSGPIGFDNQNGIYFPGKIYNSNNQTTPTIGTACGTGGAVTGTATAGVVAEGTGTVSLDTCGITFAAAYPATPYCTASSNKSATPSGVSATPGGLLFNHLGSAASLRIGYICVGQQP